MASQYLGTENLPTNAAQVQQLPAGTQYGIDQAMLQRALAQAMLARGQQLPEGQTVVTGAGAPNRYVKPAWSQVAASLANTGLGAAAMGQSYKSLYDAMQKYQGDVNATQGGAAGMLGGGASAPSAQLGGLPAGVTSDQAIAAYQRMKSSGIPATMAEADKLLPFIADLRMNESKMATEQAMNRARIEAENARAVAAPGAAVATAPSKVEAAKASGLPGVSSLQPPVMLPPSGPAGPGTSFNPQLGTLTTQEQSTGAVSQNTTALPPELIRQQQAAALQQVNAHDKEAEEGQDAAISSAHMVNIARAGQQLLQRRGTVTGPRALDRAELQQYGALLTGEPLKPGTTDTYVLHNLNLNLMQEGKTATGVTIRNKKEWDAFAQAVGLNQDIPGPALNQFYRNMELNGQQEMINFNRKLDNYASHAKRVGAIDTFSGRKVDSSWAAPVEIPAQAPIDLRGKIRGQAAPLPPVTVQPGALGPGPASIAPIQGLR